MQRRFLILLAIVFAGATVLYSGVFIFNINWRPAVELGFNTEYVEAEHAQLVKTVMPGSPAEKAGLKLGDHVVRMGGEDLVNSYTWSEVYARFHPGDNVQLIVRRPYVPGLIMVNGTFRAAGPLSTADGFAGRVDQVFNLLFLVVGLAVLFLRVEDPNAWLLALMFASFIAAPNLPNLARGLGLALRPFLLAYRAIFDSLLAGFFNFFFAVFPARSPVDRRAPWLKWVGLGIGLCYGIAGLTVGDQQSPALLVALIGDKAATLIRLLLTYSFIALGIFSLVGNTRGACTAEARRKIRVILWGTLAGLSLELVLSIAGNIGFDRPEWLNLISVMLILLFPLSFAYAVVKHRVLEIPVLLKRSARYMAVQRGFTILLSVVSVGATLLFAVTFAQYLHPHTEAGMPSGIALGAVFGTLVLWTGTHVHKGVGGRIDRAFFRSAYDARQVLENLAQNSRQAKGREPLADLLIVEITSALHPAGLAVYFLADDGQLKLEGSAAPEQGTPALSPNLPLLQELRDSGKPMDVAPAADESIPAPSIFGTLQPECLVPLLGGDGSLTGAIVLGIRLSEEPYSREDKRLLASVASQASVALETIHLGEEIAERIAAERRSEQEMQFAREVQNRLFPQKLPPLASLDYTGNCVPTRHVGGDYYDFLELRPGRVALVLADIAGKGVSGALLMANLQANLRSQYALALDDLPRLLGSVNHLFFENTSPSSYATLFFGDYDDSTRRLRYVNCGHLPPLVLRAPTSSGNEDPIVERLDTTGTVVGLFDQWDCTVAETQLATGDTLVLYTDGVTEAANGEGEEFGEDRLIEFLRTHSHLPVDSLLAPLVAAIHKFSPGEQADDITLVVARCRA